MAFYTKAYLLAETRAILNEPTALFWTDTELNDFIDWGARTISGITLCNPVTEVISPGAGFVADGLWANSTTDFIKIDDVSIVSSTSVVKHLQRTDIRAFGHGAGTWGAAGDTDRQPLRYYIHGADSTSTSTTAQPITTIFLWPVPKGIWLTSATLNVYGYRVAQEYVRDTTVYEIPDRLQGYLIDFVLACAYAKSGKYSLTSRHMATFMQNAAFDRRNVYEAKRIVDSKDRFDIPDRTQQGGK